MAKDPAFLFYSQDFIVGTITMSFEDKGKYITLLSLMHQRGRMDEETIRLLVGSISVNLKSKFLVDEYGLWYNVKLESETKKRNEFTESRRNNGSLGGRPKKTKKASGKPKNNLVDNHMLNHMGIENEDVNKDSINIKKVLEVFPEKVENIFQKFLEMRKKIKKPATEYAEELLRKELRSLSNQSQNLAIEILQQSIKNNWQDIYPLKNTQNGTKSTTTTIERTANAVETVINNRRNSAGMDNG